MLWYPFAHRKGSELMVLGCFPGQLQVLVLVVRLPSSSSVHQLFVNSAYVAVVRKPSLWLSGTMEIMISGRVRPAKDHLFAYPCIPFRLASIVSVWGGWVTILRSQGSPWGWHAPFGGPTTLDNAGNGSGRLPPRMLCWVVRTHVNYTHKQRHKN